MEDSKNKVSEPIFYILISCLFLVFTYFVYDSGNISVKGIEANINTEPAAFYTIVIIVFIGCLSIFLYGLIELIKVLKSK